MNKVKIFISLVLFFLLSGTGVAQEVTKVVVRAKAKDANFIGSSMGGAMITIKNAETGELLAKGLTKGSTGNTKKLVISPKKRYEKISTKGSAKFTAALNIDKPVYATISATTTYRNKHEVTSSMQAWLIPGIDITGDGIILEIPGFVVDVFDVQSDYRSQSNKMSVKFKTKVVMMCGCPTEPDGLWNSSKFKMKAMLKKNGETIQTIPLEFSGKISIYNGNFKYINPSGTDGIKINKLKRNKYKIVVYAFDPRTENSGIDVETIMFQ